MREKNRYHTAFWLAVVRGWSLSRTTKIAPFMGQTRVLDSDDKKHPSGAKPAFRAMFDCSYL
jgi:hypothetical protein